MVDITPKGPIGGCTSKEFLDGIKAAFKFRENPTNNRTVVIGTDYETKNGKLYNNQNEVAYIASTRGKAVDLLDLFCSQDRFSADFILPFITRDRASFALDLHTLHTNSTYTSLVYHDPVMHYASVLSCFEVFWLDLDSCYYLYNDDGIEQVIAATELIQIFT